MPQGFHATSHETTIPIIGFAWRSELGGRSGSASFLQRELKFKAFRKGATSIVSFSVQLQQLHMPMYYRVLVIGSAVRTRR
jgi:hypothetical protein